MQNGGLSQIWSSKSLTLTFMSKYSVALMQKKWNKKEILTQINLALTKGQLISQCPFGVFTSFQKRNQNKLVVKSNLFVIFLEEKSAWKNHFEFVWPLPFWFKRITM